MTDDLIAQAREMQKRMIATTLPGELADALEAKDRRIAELEADKQKDVDGLKRAVNRIAALEAALKPFADAKPIHGEYGEIWIGVLDEYLRAARAAYLGEKE